MTDRPAAEDVVNHPKHYTAHPSGVECIDLIEHLPGNLFCAIKYVWRAGLKSKVTYLEDLKKTRWYLARERARLLKRPSARAQLYLLLLEARHLARSVADYEGLLARVLTDLFALKSTALMDTVPHAMFNLGTLIVRIDLAILHVEEEISRLNPTPVSGGP
jgi:uncharacterized protein DUF3310